MTGENGLLSKAATARQRTAEAEQDEKDKLSSYEDEIDNYGTWERTGEGGNTTQNQYIPINYSTEEQEIGIKWIDGRPLYQKSYSLTTPSSKGVETTLVSLDSEINVVNIFGLANGFPINYYDTANWYIRTVFSANAIKQAAAGFLNYPEVITIQYTKTTDAAAN